MNDQIITPKSEWHTLSDSQLLDTKYAMQNLYYNMKDSKASFAKQYLTFVDDIEMMIASRAAAAALDD